MLWRLDCVFDWLYRFFSCLGLLFWLWYFFCGWNFLRCNRVVLYSLWEFHKVSWRLRLSFLRRILRGLDFVLLPYRTFLFFILLLLFWLLSLQFLYLCYSILRESRMSQKKLFCLANNFELLLFLSSLLNFSSIKLQPGVDLLLISVARLEDFELDLSVQLFQQDRLDVFGDHFPEVFDCDFIVDVDSFLELDYHRIALC